MNTLDEYIDELIEITSNKTGLLKQDIKINRDAAKEYFDDGIPPYFCFREEFTNY